MPGDLLLLSAFAAASVASWASHLGTEMKSHLLFTVALSILVVPCWSADHGQIPNDLPDHVRSWFKSVKSHNGTPCCDIADGHRTTWRAGKNGYEVPIEGIWHEVPPEAVVYNAGNPIDEAIVWYVGEGIDTNGKSAFYIRCFVPSHSAAGAQTTAFDCGDLASFDADALELPGHRAVLHDRLWSWKAST